METQGLAILPCFSVAWTLIGLTITYTMTMTNGHASSFLIYISEAGSYYPESTIFTIVFSVTAVLIAIVLYIMYRFMVIRNAALDLRFPWIYEVMLVMGWISCLGTLLVAVFPVGSCPIIHRVGAFTSFGFGAIYTITQSYHLTKTSFSSARTCCLRMASSIVMGLGIFIFIVCKCILYLGGCHGSFCVKICDVSAISAEWLATIVFTLHFLTYFTDFQHLCIKWQKSLKDDWIVVREEIQPGQEL